MKLSFKNCIKKILIEINDIDEWYEEHANILRDILESIKNQQKITFKVIKASQYHAALKEFMKYGEFIGRFPTKYILDWKDLVLENIATLEVLTSLAGHTDQFPFDDFLDVFDYSDDSEGEYTTWLNNRYNETGDEQYKKINDSSNAYDFLANYKHIDDFLPLFSNGQWLLSDYGLKPLYKLGTELVHQTDPNQIIVTINKILDVTHQRSDLAELFIQGGSKTLSHISNGY